MTPFGQLHLPWIVRSKDSPSWALHWMTLIMKRRKLPTLLNPNYSECNFSAFQVRATSVSQKSKFFPLVGHVAFNDIGDRISWTLIEQMINEEYITLGFYDTVTDNLTWYDQEQWYPPGRPPKDRTEIVPTLMTVNRTLFVSLSAISLIGIVIAFLLLCFNYKFRNNRFVWIHQNRQSWLTFWRSLHLPLQIHPNVEPILEQYHAYRVDILSNFDSAVWFGWTRYRYRIFWSGLQCQLSAKFSFLHTKSNQTIFSYVDSRGRSFYRWDFRSSSAPCLPKLGSVMCCTHKTNERYVNSGFLGGPLIFFLL